jgi:hypothetical protein
LNQACNSPGAARGAGKFKFPAPRLRGVATQNKILGKRAWLAIGVRVPYQFAA